MADDPCNKFLLIEATYQNHPTKVVLLVSAIMFVSDKKLIPTMADFT